MIQSDHVVSPAGRDPLENPIDGPCQSIGCPRTRLVSCSGALAMSWIEDRDKTVVQLRKHGLQGGSSWTA